MTGHPADVRLLPASSFLNLAGSSSGRGRAARDARIQLMRRSTGTWARSRSWVAATGVMFMTLVVRVRPWTFAVLVVVGGLAGLQPALAGAAGLSLVPRPTWITDGQVRAVLPVGGVVYIGGEFGYVGPNTGSGVSLERSSGQPVRRFPRIEDGFVQAAVPDGAGGYYVGGSFSRVGGLARAGLVHVRADGSVDPGWTADVEIPEGSQGVRALALSGSTLYVGGDFAVIGGQAHSGIAALDAQTGAVTDWSPSVHAKEFDAATVMALAVSGSTVYIGGRFDSIGGEARHDLGAVDVSTGAVTGWNPNPRGVNDWVGSLAAQGKTIYIGGSFATIGGEPRSGIAGIDTTTGAATSWNPNPNGIVDTVAVSGSTIYAGGLFTDLGGKKRQHIAAIDAGTGEATAWNPGANGFVNALAVTPQTVYAGGEFTSLGARPRHYLGALDVRTGSVRTWNPSAGGDGTTSDVDVLAASRSTVYAGGIVNSIGGGMRHGIAGLDPRTGAATAWNPDASGVVYTLAAAGSTVYAGGDFTRIGGRARNYIAALDAKTGTATAWNPNADEIVHTIVAAGSTIYAGGSFITIGGRARGMIAALDARTGAARRWNPNAHDDVDTLAVSGSTVYAGGKFLRIASTSRR